jgi:DNA-3-methyladenine glycosylase I
MSAHALIIGDDGLSRCLWGDSPPDYRLYHDTEWGFPVADDRRLFEKLSLEGFQAGLSWLTILRKRENFRAAFDGFDVRRVADYGPEDVTRLLGDAGIVRHRGKIEAVINNAGRAIELIAAEGSLAAFMWAYEPAPPGTGGSDVVTLQSESAASRAMSKELKRRGWRFVGPTTLHSLIQAMGMVNEHDPGCAVHPRVEAARAGFLRPGGTPPPA